MQKRKTVKNPYSVKPLAGAGSEVAISAKIGGVGNKPAAKSEKKGGK